MSKFERTSSKKVSQRDKAAEIANIFESLITALILALVFITFVMQAFRIPTGSMADTLKGAHFRLRCPQCGYEYDHGFDPQDYGLAQDTIPAGYVEPTVSRCPNCGHFQPTGGTMSISNGDRILVLKCIYQFLEPKRWDVIVFKDPLDPTISYIKRLVALPGETVEIIDGDVYIDGQISRKPAKVQNELWMPVYDNDYQPVRPKEPSFNKHTWQQPFKNIEESKWHLDKDSPAKFCLDSPAEQVSSLIYDSTIGNDFKATYAYGSVREYERMPYCSDLMVRFYAQSPNRRMNVGIELGKYKSRYKARVDDGDEMVITKTTEDGKTAELARKSIRLAIANTPLLVKFTNVDHQLIFQFGSENLSYDLGRSAEAAGQRKTDVQPQVKIFGSGKLTLWHTAIFRDIHYTEPRFGNKATRAAEGNPFTLAKDEFFVLGDNSPNSADGRLWYKAGVGNNGLFYRQGVVPRDYLVGKAVFVYWPSGFECPWPEGIKMFLLKNSRRNGLARILHRLVSLNWIPNIGQMRFIYGGSGKNL